jgi:hypothetical protein
MYFTVSLGKEKCIHHKKGKQKTNVIKRIDSVKSS